MRLWNIWGPSDGSPNVPRLSEVEVDPERLKEEDNARWSAFHQPPANTKSTTPYGRENLTAGKLFEEEYKAGPLILRTSVFSDPNDAS